MSAATLTPTEIGYARLLYLSGLPTTAIAWAVATHVDVVGYLARTGRWQRRTPERRYAVIGQARPVLVRCAECGGLHGAAMPRPARPCPRCGAESWGLV